MTRIDASRPDAGAPEQERKTLRRGWSNMQMRMEHDTMGEIAVPAERHWGAQTQRSLENFPIGTEKMPREILRPSLI